MILITGFLRGHPIFLKNEEWFYEDTKMPTVGNERVCGHCGRGDTKEGHDGCLGTLPGVMNACCGHGTADSAYIQFDPQTVVRGDEAIKVINQLLQHNS